MVDEAHHLKNATTKRFQRVSDLEGEFRILLTGTPVQNSVGEMLSLLRFAAADLFAGAVPETDAFVLEDGKATSDGWDIVVEAFVEELQSLTSQRQEPDAAAAAASAASQTPPRPVSLSTGQPAQAGSMTQGPSPGTTPSTSLIDTIRRIMQPFILQRTKADVSLGLPPKLSRVQCLPMLPQQGKLYAAIVETLRLLAARRAAPASFSASAAVSGAAASSSAASSGQAESLASSCDLAEAEPSSAEARVRKCKTHHQRLYEGPFVGGVTSAVLAGSQHALPGALMLMRRAAGHPALLRCIYPDRLALALVRAAHFLDRARDTRPVDEDAATAAAADAVARVREVADELGVTQVVNMAGAVREFAETGDLEDDQLEPAGGTHDNDALRVRAALIPAASQVGPSPTLTDLVAWADGNRSLAKEGEQVLGMSDFELSEQLCAFYPELSCWRLPDQYLLSSNKVRETLRCIHGVRERGAKVLVFSQFNIVLDILEAILQAWGLSWLRLDGSTAAAERQERCDKFCSDPSIAIFLLTTRAGGLGLNLVAADTVILFDCDWNPQNDRQAEDRAHRMGQTRPVNVIRMASEGSIEERMLRVAEGKRQLERVILDTPSRSEEKDILDAMMRDELLGDNDAATSFAGAGDTSAAEAAHGLDPGLPLPAKRPRLQQQKQQQQQQGSVAGPGKGDWPKPQSPAAKRTPAEQAQATGPSEAAGPSEAPRPPARVQCSVVTTPPASPSRV